MDRKEIDELVEKYARAEGMDSDLSWLNYSTQYDNRSAEINYSLVRHFKPKVVVEFGTRTGRCTNDILRALIKNGGDFIYKPYELEDEMRTIAQEEINKRFEDKAVTIGGDITKATDIPDNIEYLFVDNYHDEPITKWLFDVLIKKCVDGCLVQIHDMKVVGNVESASPSFVEQDIIINMHKEGKLPLEKVYFTWEEGEFVESTWWRYKK